MKNSAALGEEISKLNNGRTSLPNLKKILFNENIQYWKYRTMLGIHHHLYENREKCILYLLWKIHKKLLTLAAFQKGRQVAGERDGIIFSIIYCSKILVKSCDLLLTQKIHKFEKIKILTMAKVTAKCYT